MFIFDDNDFKIDCKNDHDSKSICKIITLKDRINKSKKVYDEILFRMMKLSVVENYLMIMKILVKSERVDL